MGRGAERGPHAAGEAPRARSFDLLWRPHGVHSQQLDARCALQGARPLHWQQPGYRQPLTCQQWGSAVTIYCDACLHGCRNHVRFSQWTPPQADFCVSNTFSPSLSGLLTSGEDRCSWILSHCPSPRARIPVSPGSLAAPLQSCCPPCPFPGRAGGSVLAPVSLSIENQELKLQSQSSPKGSPNPRNLYVFPIWTL